MKIGNLFLFDRDVQHLQGLRQEFHSGGTIQKFRSKILNVHFSYSHFGGLRPPHACPSGANICLRQTFYFIWICIEQKKMFGRDILLYMNLHRAKNLLHWKIIMHFFFVSASMVLQIILFSPLWHKDSKTVLGFEIGQWEVG